MCVLKRGDMMIRCEREVQDAQTCGCASCKHMCTWIVETQTNIKWRNGKAQPIRYQHPESLNSPQDGLQLTGSMPLRVGKGHKSGRATSALSALVSVKSTSVLTVIWLTSSREILPSMTHSQINPLGSYFSQIQHFSKNICHVSLTLLHTFFSPIRFRVETRYCYSSPSPCSCQWTSILSMMFEEEKKWTIA